MRLIIICGGPSLERGISLNSARSVMDHLASTAIDIDVLYVDHNKHFFIISKNQLYSNTPSDFDFKLQTEAQHLSKESLKHYLQTSDLVFPLIHGAFGEDGALQELLENDNIPFIGSGSDACKRMFNKYLASQELKACGFDTLPSLLINTHTDTIPAFWEQYSLKRAIIKPIAGGSSIGVTSVNSLEEALEKVSLGFHYYQDNSLMLEPFCEGIEFTICVLNNHANQPISLLPTEIQTSYQNNQIFDYRRKYLPTGQVHYHCPARFTQATIAAIQTEAQTIFKHFGMRDFIRIDGWLMPDGKRLYTDINPISGMEQNSFIFQQAATIGLSHTDLLQYIIQSACIRYGIPYASEKTNPTLPQKKVCVLMGGQTAERQVSLMSGTNVWLKLLQSNHFAPEPYLWAPDGSVWQLPYAFTLHHTVEEVLHLCLHNTQSPDISTIRQSLGLEPDNKLSSLPIPMSLDAFIDQAHQQTSFVFLALHGGSGENGDIQQRLEAKKIPFNGSGPEGSRNCIDKVMTSTLIHNACIPNIQTLPEYTIHKKSFCLRQPNEYLNKWKKITEKLGTSSLIIKPANDGCSAGVVRLENADDLRKYIAILHARLPEIPPHTFPYQNSIVQMPKDFDGVFLVQPCIQTDSIKLSGKTITYLVQTGWIEMTIGITESKGIYHAFYPSITVAHSQVLSVEEKFQSGTGVNITPPPTPIINLNQLQLIQKTIENVAHTLAIKNYARIDFFFNTQSNQIIIIEANTLPALTPSTVIFHQALAETPSMNPQSFLEKIINNSLEASVLAPSSV